MIEAKLVKEKFGTERNHPTGAVVVLCDRVIGRGANQAALRNTFLRNLHGRGFCVRRFLKVKTGTKYWLCPGCADFHLHAEALAVADARTNNKNIKGADLYLYGHWWCCKPCWDVMIRAGIKNVYLMEGSEDVFNGSR